MKEYIFEIYDETTVAGGHPSKMKEELVRCKDCKWSILDKVNGALSCWTGRGVDDNDYCSRGERGEREEE